MTQVVAPSESISTNLSGAICVLRLQGSLGRASVPRIRRLANEIGAAGCRAILVDASLLEAVTAECADALEAFSTALHGQNVRVRTYGAGSAVADTLDTLRHAP